MTDFASALDYVHATLAALEAEGAKLTATRTSLAALAAAAPVPATPQRAIPVSDTSSPTPRRTASAAPILPTLPPLTVPAVPPAPGSKAARLAALYESLRDCPKCAHLVASRTQVVFGVGSPDASLMFVGEAPGEDEDRQGEPFVGKAGQLLTKIITAMGFPREQVFIANVLKCRPDMPPGASGNRKPAPSEMQTCLPYLQEQIAILQPKVLVALGATAMEGLLGATEAMSRLRGRWHSFQDIPLMATYHPAYLLRNQSLSEKRKVWEDMLLVLEKLGLEITEKQRAYFLPKE